MADSWVTSGLQLLEQIALGLFHGEAGDTLQHLQLVLLGLLGLGLGGLQFGQAGGELFFFFLDIVGLAVQGLFLLLKAVLLVAAGRPGAPLPRARARSGP